MDNGHLQIRSIKKTDEGMYTCEARVMARGEIDFKMMKVVVNGKYCNYLYLLLSSSPAVHQKVVFVQHGGYIDDDPQTPEM